MKKEKYVAPKMGVIEIEPESFIASSTQNLVNQDWDPKDE